MNLFFILAAKYLYLVPVAILGVYFLLQERGAWKRMAFFAIPAGLFALALGTLANHLYFDPRPFVALHFTPLVPHAPDNGFPSDHTLLVSAVAMIGTLWNRRLGIVLWALALLVAIGRVYVGLHHVLDVAGSVVISFVAVLLTYAAYTYLWHKEIA
ncbi:MAG: phosphatase PAP2 family protein [Patescibacteria group bacterium]|nr:phosphatase PAP2 family protein [Patescibacteria group bacterium]